ncbi:MAG: lysylphosphatidylglycerol synthase transmembrane domain-containing protein [Candidatus Uhrbacteria bacterium]|nr:lysylphosphatidylglycerol synthase transmembrane domain-containing protein [Candidatus Uhrbacteria bacterium]
MVDMNRASKIRIILFVLTLVAGSAVFVWLMLREGLDNIADHVVAFGLLPFLGFVALSLLNFVLYSWRWQIITNKQLPKERYVSLWRMFMNRMSGYAASYLTPAAQVGGEPVRIAMLVSDGVPLKQATSSVVLDIAFELSAYVTFILAGVVLAIISGVGTDSILVVLIGLAVMLVALLSFFILIAKGRSFFVPVFKILQLHRIRRLKRFEAGLRKTEFMMSEFLAGKPRLISGIAFLSVIVISFRIIEVFYIAYFFGVNLDFAQAFLVATLPGVALILPVPAGLGLFEGGFTAVFAVLSIPLSAVAFALIIRARDLVFILVGVIHMVRRGGSYLSTKLLQNNSKPNVT